MGGFASALRSLVPRPDEVQRQLLKSLKARLRNPGLRMARSEQTTPKDTGELIDSISVVGPRQEPGQVVGGLQATAPRVQEENPGHPRVDASEPGTLRMYWEEPLDVAGVDALAFRIGLPDRWNGEVRVTLLGFGSGGSQVTLPFRALASQQRRATGIGLLLPLVGLA